VFLIPYHSPAERHSRTHDVETRRLAYAVSDQVELVINMIAAKALGLTIHDSFGMLADEVIE
jgi:hypothetical protein